MKDITFICSAIISGTSMVAKVCMDHGAWFGTTEDSSSMIYDVYENARFRQLCRNALGIDKDLRGQNLFQLFQEFFEGLPENEKIVLKYPKSFYLLDDFKKIIGSDFKVVYVMRNPFMRAISIQKKNGGNIIPNYLVDWNDTYTYMAQHTRGTDVYTVIYERFFLEPGIEAKKLLDFIGLKYDKIDVSGIDSSKRHF